MESMFAGATKFNQDIRKWQVHETTTLTSMFKDAKEFLNQYGNNTDIDGNFLINSDGTPKLEFFNK